jgi:hypothetical protein
MAYTTIAGNPANYPASVRAATGSDPRNATTEAATATDLADRTAYLHRTGPASFLASLSALEAETDASPKFVDQFGWYSHIASTLTPSFGVVVAATGIGTGCWVRSDRWGLFAGSGDGTTTPPKIAPQFLMPQYQWTLPLTMAAKLGGSTASPALGTVTGSIISIGDTLEGDILTGIIGPIFLYNTDNGTSGNSAQFVVSVQDNAGGVSPPASVAEAVLYVPSTSATGGVPFGVTTVPFQHTVAVEGIVRISIKIAASVAGGTMSVATIDDSLCALGQITLHRGYFP